MKNSTLGVRPIGMGSNNHTYFFVNEKQWEDTENLPLKRNLLKTVKVDFVHKIINPPELFKNICLTNKINLFSKTEQNFINMRISLNFKNNEIYKFIYTPLNIKPHIKEIVI